MRKTLAKTRCEVIDAFNHFHPKQCLDVLPKAESSAFFERLATLRAAVDIEYRIKRIEEMGIDKQILTLGADALDGPPVETHDKIARATNEGFARIIDNYSERFYAVGVVSLHDVGTAIEELERCVEDFGLLGVQILSSVEGKPLDSPEFEPFYSKVTKLDAGLWIHPATVKRWHYWTPEYGLDSVLGWGFDESLAVFRLVRGGVLERHPGLKIIIHHMGVMIPFYADRIHRAIMREGKNGKPPKPLTKPPMDYLKMFYVDTAEGSWKPALVCSELFYGPRHMLYATDFPYGHMAPEDWPLRVMNAIGGLDISEEEKKMILGGNVTKLFNL